MANDKTITRPRFPNIRVGLVGYDGNAFSILGRVTMAMRRHGVADADIKEFMAEATSGDYDHLLEVTTRWVETE